MAALKGAKKAKEGRTEEAREIAADADGGEGVATNVVGEIEELHHQRRLAAVNRMEREELR